MYLPQLTTYLQDFFYMYMYQKLYKYSVKCSNGNMYVCFSITKLEFTSYYFFRFFNGQNEVEVSQQK